ncbi:MAG: NAD(P)H-hydrate dehydratase [Bacteroidia bacterium]|nr:NAD(P)H-hydrate dehydratase [Bacteroidia bacterium]
MLPVFTSDEIRACDQTGIEEFGIPGVVLMENAARGSADVAEAEFGPLSGKRVLIVCGKGNNGGDGFAIARHLHNRGVHVDVLTLAPDESILGDARTNLDILRRMESSSDTLHVSLFRGSAQLADLLRQGPALLVDAMLGTGLASPLTGELAEVVEVINSSPVPVLSIDVPTGISADTGDVLGCAVRAGCTATMGAYKRGVLLRKGRAHAGKVRVVDIGLPDAAVLRSAASAFLLESRDVIAMLPRRAFDVHKYQMGNVFVLAGSVGLTGAAVLASEAALRSGAGIVHLGVPASLNSIFEIKLTEVMTVPLNETDEGTLSLKDFDKILERINSASITVIGPGISRQYETQNLVRRIVEHASAPLLLDADALYALGGHLNLLQKTNAEVILTPHVGEFSRLVSQSKEEIETKRISLSQTFAVEFGVTLVLKGAPTVIASRDGNVFINPTGNPGMATAGAGDVLSGIIAGFRAQGCSSEHAASAGVYLHGQAGDHARDRVGEYGLIATDLLSSFASILKDFSPHVTG